MRLTVKYKYIQLEIFYLEAVSVTHVPCGQLDTFAGESKLFSSRVEPPAYVAHSLNFSMRFFTGIFRSKGKLIFHIFLLSKKIWKNHLLLVGIYLYRILGSVRLIIIQL